jgi:hypothetical protein
MRFGGTTYAPLNTPIDGDRDYGVAGYYSGGVLPPGMLGDLSKCNCGYEGLGDPMQNATAFGILAALGVALWWTLRPTDGPMYR